MGKNFGLGAKAGHIRFFNEFSVSDLFGMEQKVKIPKIGHIRFLQYALDI